MKPYGRELISVEKASHQVLLLSYRILYERHLQKQCCNNMASKMTLSLVLKISPKSRQNEVKIVFSLKIRQNNAQRRKNHSVFTEKFGINFSPYSHC